MRDIIGTKDPGSTLAVGDIVFNDGSAIAYNDNDIGSVDLTAAVAVIFDDTNKLGVGLQQGTNLSWADVASVGYPTKIDTLAASKTGGTTATDAVFSGATDGSGSLTKFRTAVSATDGASLSAADYPAWAFVEGYATNAGLTDTPYESGWYMPSIAELCKLYQAKTDVNNALDKIGVTKLSDTVGYWSSNQSSSTNTQSWAIALWSGNQDTTAKSNQRSVCVIHQF
jgi:hypothetical protein